MGEFLLFLLFFPSLICIFLGVVYCELWMYSEVEAWCGSEDGRSGLEEGSFEEGGT